MLSLNQTVDAPEANQATADSVPLPQRIGRYRVEKLLGQGGFGLVYLAFDDQLQRLVAVKVPHARLISRPEDAQVFLSEARTVASLDHANIVPVYDVGSTEDFPCYVVSKFVEGSTLAQKIKAKRPSVAEAVELVATVAETLQYAHRKGLVHRDVKPGNILLDADGKPYVADFGLVLREQDMGRGPRCIGTPAYMSPEQARGEGHRVDGRSDMFSLGVVFYELLTGRRPFPADSTEELLEQITSQEVRPPRQWDDTISKELERICLKALAKRASERYTTARDMADDLRHFLSSQPHLSLSAASQAREPAAAPSSMAVTEKPEAAAVTPIPSPVPSLSGPTSTTTGVLLKIVPKGLRSFDGNDADFFLELLPGPRDRDGLPDSVRFWKNRIEATDPDNTFTVALIYGPSGCGKSSLVKAGLLPRLARTVTSVYVEATADDTEARLLKGLRRQIPDLPGDLGLIESLAALRRGRFLKSGQKILLVLDQLEQWLHARRSDENTELVQALRQCDGVRVQSVVMVRDDFWMAATRFMRELEIRLVEGQNSAAVDLFPVRHAEKVLAAFGRAYGVLPELGAGKEQKQFLEQAVSGLAQEGQVICVRLALFAEMMKGRLWTPAALKDVGGTAGVGVTFLEETFSVSTAPPEHRYHQKAARAVLQSLLPESGSDIKGHMRSHGELLAASGYANRRKDFDDLIRILDSEIRLITPTDPEGKEEDSQEPAAPARDSASSQVGQDQTYYQLTHDYLVPSLRAWLTRKQKETRRGRAELMLADRAGVWTDRPENRQLPSLWQWLSIRWLTSSKNWTPPQRKMMRAADRYHALRGLAVVLAMVLLGWGGYEIHGTVKAHALAESLLRAETTQVPSIVADMPPYRRWLDPLLKRASSEAAANSEARKQLHTSLALLPTDPSQVDYLHGRLLDAAPNEIGVIRDALALHRDALLDRLWKVAEAPEKGKESQRLRAASALASFDPDNSRWDRIRDAVIAQLVAENPVFLNLWMEGFRPVRLKLLPSLADIFNDRKEERAAERSLATNILADYAADQPALLAELLMDADEKQFVVLFPKFQARADLASLEAELRKKVAVAKVVLLQLKNETMSPKEPLVKIDRVGGALPARAFQVKLQEDKGYTITMTSTELTAALVLQDETGFQLEYHESLERGHKAVIDCTVPRDGTYMVHAATAKGTGSFSLTVVESDARIENAEKLAKRQANAAVALLKMGRADNVWPLLKHSHDPRARSYLVHRLGPLGADAAVVVKRLGEEPDVTIQRALILSLSEFGAGEVSAPQRQAVKAKLQDIYCTHDDPGLHAAAEWLLRSWNEQDWLTKVNDAWAKDQDLRTTKIKALKQTLAVEKEKTPPQWYVNGQGQTMVVIPGPVEFVFGATPTEKDWAREHPCRMRIGRTFAIAAKPVTLGQYWRFDEGEHKAMTRRNPSRYTRTLDLPASAVTWHQAAAYCNWLSKQEGILEKQWCYETDDKGKVTKLREKYLSLTGYRLPTQAEMEFATRAGASTCRFFGETDELLPKYAWYQKNAQSQPWPVGSLKPNDLGLFDVQGNLFTWCQEPIDRKQFFRRRGVDLVEDVEGSLTVEDTQDRFMRGGSFFYPSPYLRSAYYAAYPPSHNDLDVGFRVVRTFTP